MRAEVVVGLAAATLALASVADGHPSGTTSVDTLKDFEDVGQGRFRVAFQVDFAEAPAYAEIDALDADHDGTVTGAEQHAYLAARLPPLVDAWVVELDGVPAHPRIVASHVDVSPGQGGLETLRVDAELELDVPAPLPGLPTALHVHDESFPGTPGWREVRAGVAGGGDAGRRVTVAGLADGGDMHRMIDVTFVFPAEPGSGTSPAHRAFTRDPRVVVPVLVLVIAGALALLGLFRRQRRRRSG